MSTARRRWVRAALVAGAALGAALVASACGVPTQGAAHVLTGNQVPPPQTTVTLPQKGPLKAVYWVDGSLLVKQTLAFPTATTLTEVLAALLRGPTSIKEATTGLATDLGTSVALLGTHQTKTSVVVNLSPAFREITRSPLALAAAQVVYTVNEFFATPKKPTTTPGISVSFEVTSIPYPVTIGDGQAELGPVSVKDYAGLVSTG